MINLFGESIPTREAREAQDILQHFSISLNLQEYQSLAETSRETERDSFGDIASTKAANEANIKKLFNRYDFRPISNFKRTRKRN